MKIVLRKGVYIYIYTIFYGEGEINICEKLLKLTELYSLQNT